MARDRKAYQAEYYQKNKERLNEYKRKYHKDVKLKNYKEIHFDLPKELVEEFEVKLKKEGLTKTEVLTKAIEKYIGKRGWLQPLLLFKIIKIIF